MQKLKHIVLATILALVMSACGGGSDDSSAPPSTVSSGNDSDNDGVIDSEDAFPNDYSNRSERKLYNLEDEKYNVEVYKWQPNEPMHDYSVGHSSYSTISTFNGYTYLVYVDYSFKIHLVKIEPDKITATESILKDLDGNDYIMRNDNHHRWSIGIDEKGYIHVAGDMHNYSVFSSDSHMPANMQDGNCNYWRSDKPENISSFTWHGKTSESSPVGTGWTYIRFINDHQGRLYFSGRSVNTKTHPYYRAFSASKYDAEAKQWYALGGENPKGNVSLVWEDNAEYGSNGYSRIFGKLWFDYLDRMHVAVPLLNSSANANTTLGHYSNTAVYLRSDDYGSTFRRADNSIVSVPARIDATDNSKVDIVYEHDWLRTQSRVWIDYLGRPIVTIANVAGEWKLHQWSQLNSQWKELQGHGLSYDDDSILVSDRAGVLTQIQRTSIIRMWHPTESLKDQNGTDLDKREFRHGHVWLDLDLRHVMMTGNIKGIAPHTKEIVEIEIKRPVLYPASVN